MKKTDNPLKLGSQCVLDWDNVIDLTFKSNGQIISIHRNNENELEISGVGIPTTLQERMETASKHFKEIMKKADELDAMPNSKKIMFNKPLFEYKMMQQKELTKMKEIETQEDIETINKQNEINAEAQLLKE